MANGSPYGPSSAVTNIIARIQEGFWLIIVMIVWWFFNNNNRNSCRRFKTCPKQIRLCWIYKQIQWKSNFDLSSFLDDTDGKRWIQLSSKTLLILLPLLPYHSVSKYYFILALLWLPPLFRPLVANVSFQPNFPVSSSHLASPSSFTTNLYHI